MGIADGPHDFQVGMELRAEAERLENEQCKKWLILILEEVETFKEASWILNFPGLKEWWDKTSGKAELDRLHALQKSGLAKLTTDEINALGIKR